MPIGLALLAPALPIAAAANACHEGPGASVCVAASGTQASASYTHAADHGAAGATTACGTLDARPGTVAPRECGTSHASDATGTTQTCANDARHDVILGFGAIAERTACLRHAHDATGSQQACLATGVAVTPFGTGGRARSCSAGEDAPHVGDWAACGGASAFAGILTQVAAQSCGPLPNLQAAAEAFPWAPYVRVCPGSTTCA